MPSTTNVLDEARDLIKKRLDEVNEERKRLEHAVSSLGGKVVGGPGHPPGRPAGSGSKAATPRRRRRKGGRAGQAVRLVKKNPGISAAEIAKALKINPNYLYRVLSELEKEGRVKKDGRRYSPAG